MDSFFIKENDVAILFQRLIDQAQNIYNFIFPILHHFF
jgi:hypothetical protein